VDITNDGQSSGTQENMDIQVGTGGVRVVGGASFAASFGRGTYGAYTCVDFKGEGFELGKPTEYGGWMADKAVLGTTNLDIDGDWSREKGALLTFSPAPAPATTILVRVGISLMSTEQACANAESEIPNFNFTQVHDSARTAWNELLGRIQVDTTGVDEDTVKLFYSSLYRTHISPADYTDENPKWKSTEPYYDSLYCNWDTYRTLYPLFSLHDPENFARIVRGMINIQKNEGWLPECRGATVKHYVQGGSNADPILGEFFVKFHEQAERFNVSADDLYTALLADAENQPSNWDEQGRQVDVWKEYNFIPQDVYHGGGMNTRHVSRTLEYAFDDFAISQVAKILNKTDDSAKYAARAANYLNVWNPNITVPDGPDVWGMMQPRLANMSWVYTDPRHCSVNDPTHSSCFLDGFNMDGFYESSPIVYSQASISSRIQK
jgi:putative alpha-1,2-mannosidase